MPTEQEFDDVANRLRGGEIFGHGSGVSAAIYDLYRRKQ